MTDTRQLYEQKAQAQLEQLAADTKKLKAQVKEANADAALELQDKMNQLEKKLLQANQEFENFKQAGAESWQNLKLGVETNLQKIQQEISTLTNSVDRK